MIHRLFYYLLLNYVNLGLNLFFKKLKVVGSSNIPDKDPVIFVANHQNALIDALLVVTQNKRKTHFVARADVFKRPFLKKLLALIYMMPIYRIRDGRHSLFLNDEIFERCKSVLLKGESFMIFPEGNHSFDRRLRPLSKGFTRIALGALDVNKDLNLKVVPVGINYTDHQKYRGSVSLYFGDPIDVKKLYTGDFNIDSAKLKEAVAKRLKTLITHIEDQRSYNEQLQRLTATNPDFLNPFDTNLRLQNLDNYQPEPAKKPEMGIMKLLKLPFVLNAILPLSIWLMIKRGIKDPVMVASIKFCVGIFLFPVFLVLQSLSVTYWLGDWAGILYFIISLAGMPLISSVMSK
ncbi:lysophospholipid acyltransferase family protein [Fulvivirga lutimaris]|uniref:lysophospholipid acyltransferase family protein n=1 Tax=Fulvivirga lutimaris TaxID=1819566 RepID=UPI0012BD03A6|nr:lysophospholipid acyltransferase family protein [Fulvivirga lutimaris]MTI39042.1 acyltransferase [Fulvivirga lutimaris]